MSAAEFEVKLPTVEEHFCRPSSEIILVDATLLYSAPYVPVLSRQVIGEGHCSSAQRYTTKVYIT